MSKQTPGMVNSLIEWLKGESAKKDDKESTIIRLQEAIKKEKNPKKREQLENRLNEIQEQAMQPVNVTGS